MHVPGEQARDGLHYVRGPVQAEVAALPVVREEHLGQEEIPVSEMNLGLLDVGPALGDERVKLDDVPDGSAANEHVGVEVCAVPRCIQPTPALTEQLVTVVVPVALERREVDVGRDHRPALVEGLDASLWDDARVAAEQYVGGSPGRVGVLDEEPDALGQIDATAVVLVDPGQRAHHRRDAESRLPVGEVLEPGLERLAGDDDVLHTATFERRSVARKEPLGIRVRRRVSGAPVEHVLRIHDHAPHQPAVRLVGTGRQPPSGLGPVRSLHEREFDRDVRRQEEPPAQGRVLQRMDRDARDAVSAEVAVTQILNSHSRKQRVAGVDTRSRLDPLGSHAGRSARLRRSDPVCSGKFYDAPARGDYVLNARVGRDHEAEDPHREIGLPDLGQRHAAVDENVVEGAIGLERDVARLEAGSGCCQGSAGAGRVAESATDQHRSEHPFPHPNLFLNHAKAGVY